jgi:hypothetical protein
VKFDERQFKDFVLMSVEKKCEYIEKYRNLKDEFRRFFEELIEEIDETEKKFKVQEAKL